jgi:hypothetical protein
MVAEAAIMVVAEEAVNDKARITLAWPMQQREVFAPILAPMCLTTVRSLQQTKCELHGKSLCSMLAPNMGKTLSMDCRKITVFLVEPVHTDDVLMRHGVREVMIRTGH